MSWQKWARTLLLFALLLAMHFTVRPVLQWRVAPDFLVIAVLLAAVRVRPGVAALVGFVTGLMADALSPSTFGAAAVALTTVGFGASWLKAVFFSDNVVLHAFFFFLGKWAFDVVFLLVARQHDIFGWLTQVALWSPLSAGATALAGLVVLMLFRGMLEASPT
jgi:rod shape-determining protein MreD